MLAVLLPVIRAQGPPWRSEVDTLRGDLRADVASSLRADRNDRGAYRGVRAALAERVAWIVGAAYRLVAGRQTVAQRTLRSRWSGKVERPESAAQGRDLHMKGDYAIDKRYL